MKIEIPQKKLKESLGLVGGTVGSKSTLPVLLNVLIQAEGDTVTFVTTNLEQLVKVHVKCSVKEPGSITLPYKTLSDMVSVLPSDDVTISVNSKRMEALIQCGKNDTNLKGIDPKEFPPMAIGGTQKQVKSKVLARELMMVINQGGYAASTDEARPVLMGVKTELSDHLLMASTDGFTIAVQKLTTDDQVEETSVIVPAKALDLVAKIFKNEEDIDIVVFGDAQMIFKTDNYELTSQLISGNYPDYNAIIPKSFKTDVTVDTSALLKALKQVGVIAALGTNVARMNFKPNGDETGVLELSTTSEETGSTDVEMPIQINGPPIMIAFNVSFLTRMVEKANDANSPTLRLKMTANNTPMGVFKEDVAGRESVGVIMPMHLG